MVQLAVLSVILAWIAAQIGKLFTQKKYKFKTFMNDGGMPSSHSAVVAALSTSIVFEEGLSLLALVTIIFSIIVVWDARGVRRSTGIIAEIINKLHGRKLREQVGHSPLEVVAGIVLGIIVAVLVYLV